MAGAPWAPTLETSLPPVIKRHPALSVHLLQLRRLPTPPPLCSDTLKERRGRLNVGMMLAPFGSQVSAEGCREYRLSEALQQRGNRVDGLAGQAAMPS